MTTDASNVPFFKKICHSFKLVLRTLSWPFRIIYNFSVSTLRRIVKLLKCHGKTFNAIYESQYGPVHAKFFSGSFAAAKEAAARQRKILAVYLHNEEGAYFCSSILTNPLVIELLDENFVLYVEHIKGVRMRILAQITNAWTIPHVAFLKVSSLSEFFVISGTNQLNNEDVFLSMLIELVESRPSSFSNLSQVEAERRLRVEQDAELVRSMEIDKQKLAQRDARRRQTQQRLEQERIKQETKSEKKRRALERRKTLSVEYTQTNANGPLDTKIKVRLASGATIEAKFSRFDTIGKLYDWVEATPFTSGNKSIKIPISFTLNTTFPSKSLVDRNITLEEAKLYPDAVLTLISLDSDYDSDSE